MKLHCYYEEMLSPLSLNTLCKPKSIDLAEFIIDPICPRLRLNCCSLLIRDSLLLFYYVI